MTPTEVSFDPAVSAIRLVEDVDFNDISDGPHGSDDVLTGLLDGLVASMSGPRNERHGRFWDEATVDKTSFSFGLSEPVALGVDVTSRRCSEDAHSYSCMRRRVSGGCQSVSQRELIDFAHHCLRTGQDTGLAFEALRAAERRAFAPSV